MSNLPRPVTTADFYLASILDELRQMKDRLPSPAATPEPGLTPLSEPARPQMTPLPDDFPARDKLAAVGILYLETVPRDGDDVGCHRRDRASHRRVYPGVPGGLMAFTLDYSTSTGKVRLLISDIDAANPNFADAAIDAFVDMARGGQVKRAAALALRTLAANETLVQKRIKTLDLSTDGPAEAEALRTLANDLEDQANEDEATEDGGAFDWAEMVTNPFTYQERIVKEWQRESG